MGVNDVAEGLETLVYAKSNTKFPTFALLQKIWNKARHLQAIKGFIKYNPIWNNGYYPELQFLTCGARWRKHGVTHLNHIFEVGKLSSFSDMQERFRLPRTMYFYYMQLQHAVRAQTSETPWMSSPTPIFHYMEEVSCFKGYISCCYSMLLSVFLAGFPLGAVSKWENDVGTFEEEQWEEVLQAVKMSSLNVAQRLSQLYIVLRVHYTPARLFKMGGAQTPIALGVLETMET